VIEDGAERARRIKRLRSENGKPVDAKRCEKRVNRPSSLRTKSQPAVSVPC
jgi:hypothetical protein